MNKPTSQAAKVDLRKKMPETAKWVDQKRKELGVEFVNGCIRAALRGEAGFFYAIEQGHLLGTPFPATHPVAATQNYAVLHGCKFAAFIATPKKSGGNDGTHRMD